MARAHGKRSPNQQATAAGLVDIEEDDGRKDDEKRILNSGRHQKNVSS